MKYYPGNIINFRYPAAATSAVLVLASRDTTVAPGISKSQVMYSEVEVLRSDGTTGWYNEDCFL